MSLASSRLDSSFFCLATVLRALASLEAPAAGADGAAVKSTTTVSIPVDSRYLTTTLAGSAALDDAVANSKGVSPASVIFWSSKILILPAKSLCKLAIDTSVGATLKNSSTKSALAIRGSFTSAEAATNEVGVLVSCNAITTTGTGVAVFAVFGLKTKVLVVNAFSAETDAKESWAKDCSRAMDESKKFGDKATTTKFQCSRAQNR